MKAFDLRHLIQEEHAKTGHSPATPVMIKTKDGSLLEVKDVLVNYGTATPDGPGSRPHIQIITK
jgi:hypothetical protein